MSEARGREPRHPGRARDSGLRRAGGWAIRRVSTRRRRRHLGRTRQAGEDEEAEERDAARSRRREEPDAADAPGTPEEPPETDDSEAVRAGFAEEFDEIERELDAELRALEGDEDELDVDEPEEDEELDDEDELESDGGGAGGSPGTRAGRHGRGRRRWRWPIASRPRRPRWPDCAPEPPSTRPRSRPRCRRPRPTPTPRGSCQPTIPAAPAAEVADDDSGPPRASRLWARFLAASLVIVVAMATATSVSLLLYLTDIASGLGDNDSWRAFSDQLTGVDGGEPQTILILGSDKRPSLRSDPGRSDTTILLRVDPDQDAITLLSIPRDLKVNIPGRRRRQVQRRLHGRRAEADARGRQAAHRPRDQPRRQRRLHRLRRRGRTRSAASTSTSTATTTTHAPELRAYAEIDVEAGYQRLCGYNALQYVRYRHDDNDLVRSARQQDFLREARQKLPPRGAASRDARQADRHLHRVHDLRHRRRRTLLERAEAVPRGADAPVREVHFPAELGRADRSAT